MKPIVLAITGASAQPLAERALQLLLINNYNVHLIISKGAYKVWQSENDVNIPAEPIKQEEFWRDKLNEKNGKLKCYRWNDNSADIASGSFTTHSMLIIPCTMGTIGRIASGVSLNLIERCADVHLKEGRPLLLAPRESPLSIIHLNNLILLANSGAKIIPPIPAWYNKPKTIDDMIDFIIARFFDSINIEIVKINRWGD